MSVLIDTSVWTLAVRRRPEVLSDNERRMVQVLTDLIDSDQIMILGPVRQEVLSGIRYQNQYERIRERLRIWRDEPVETSDWEEAARCFNLLRAAGIVGSVVDCLLCAIALRREVSIFSTDVDFAHYSRVLPIRLFNLPSK